MSELHKLAVDLWINHWMFVLGNFLFLSSVCMFSELLCQLKLRTVSFLRCNYMTTCLWVDHSCRLSAMWLYLSVFLPATETNTAFIICNSNLWQQQIVILMMMKIGKFKLCLGSFLLFFWFGTFLSFFVVATAPMIYTHSLVGDNTFWFLIMNEKLLRIKSDCFLSLMLWKVFNVFIDSLFLCIKT